MPMGRFDRITLVPLLPAGCAILFGAWVLIEPALAQYVPPPTPLPPPVFNPSSPYTVPQPSYTPIAPSPSNATPGYVVTSPVNASTARGAARSHRRTSTTLAVAPRHRAIVVHQTPPSHSYAYPPFGYAYGCAWRRGWDGYWFRTSPCS